MLQKQKTYVATLALIVGLFSHGQSALATTIELLSMPGNEAIQKLGKAPPKKKIVLDLGALRTTEARLPNGVLTLAQRNLLRSRIALARQDEVTNANRNRLKNIRSGGKGADYVPPKPEDFDYEEESARDGEDVFGDEDTFGGDLPTSD